MFEENLKYSFIMQSDPHALFDANLLIASFISLCVIYLSSSSKVVSLELQSKFCISLSISSRDISRFSDDISLK